VASFEKTTSNSIDLDVDGKHLVKRNDITEGFSKHFKSVFSDSHPNVSHSVWSSYEFLLIESVSEVGLIKVIERLRRTKSFGVDDIPGFIIKGCADILVPVVKYIFKLSLSQNCYPILWKQAR
jgi:hypothetical protein